VDSRLVNIAQSQGYSDSNTSICFSQAQALRAQPGKIGKQIGFEKFCTGSGCGRVARGGYGANALPLAARPGETMEAAVETFQM